MVDNKTIGFALGCEVCRYCGKKFCYNIYHCSAELKASEKKRKHESVCFVRFGMKKCPKKWKETLIWKNKKIKECQKIIKELGISLNNGKIHPLLKSKAEEIVEAKIKEMRDIKRSIGDDEIDFPFSFINDKKEK